MKLFTNRAMKHMGKANKEGVSTRCPAAKPEESYCAIRQCLLLSFHSYQHCGCLVNTWQYVVVIKLIIYFPINILAVISRGWYRF